MEQDTKVVDGKFSCGKCGKEYKWKPELAGKRAKCVCGSAIVVPAAEAPPEATPPDFDNLYDFAEPTHPPPAPPAAVPAPLPAAATSRTLPYRSPPSAQKPDRSFSDASPFIDLYLPVALLAIGFAAMMAWAVDIVGAGAAGAVAVAVFTVVSTLIKTAILIGLSMIIAPWAGILFRGVGKGALKLAAILVFTDAADLWLDYIMRATGAVRPHFISIRAIFASLALAAVLISFLSRILFQTDAEETKTFALPLAILSQIIGFVLKVIVVVAILSLKGGTTPAGPIPRSPGRTITPSPPQSSAAPPWHGRLARAEQFHSGVSIT
jgi:hypothetical protein